MSSYASHDRVTNDITIGHRERTGEFLVVCLYIVTKVIPSHINKSAFLGDWMKEVGMPEIKMVKVLCVSYGFYKIQFSGLRVN